MVRLPPAIVYLDSLRDAPPSRRGPRNDITIVRPEDSSIPLRFPGHDKPGGFTNALPDMSLRASAHTGVAISNIKQKREADASLFCLVRATGLEPARVSSGT